MAKMAKTSPVGNIEPDRLYTYAQAAEFLGVNRYWVRNAVRDDRIHQSA